jgi:hypothetical protein
MDDRQWTVWRRFRFGLRWLLGAMVMASLVFGFVYQELRIRRIASELALAHQSEPVLLFRVPGRLTERQIAGYVGGQFIETSRRLSLQTRRHRLIIATDGHGLIVDLNGRTLYCKTLHFDPKFGQVTVDEAHFFERLGMDYDFSAR